MLLRHTFFFLKYPSSQSCRDGPCARENVRDYYPRDCDLDMSDHARHHSCVHAHADGCVHDYGETSSRTECMIYVNEVLKRFERS